MTPQDIRTPRFSALVASTFEADAAVDADAFVRGLTADVTFQLGGNPPVTGRDAVRGMVSEAFKAFRHVRHTLRRVFEMDDVLIYEATVTYEFAQGGSLLADYVNVVTCEGHLVRDYRIYIDLSPMARAAGAGRS